MSNWYVSSLAGGSGSGTVGSPWTLAEAVTKIDDNTVVNGDTVWIKADGVYNSNNIAITRNGGTADWVTVSGYTSVINDDGRATIRRNAGQTSHFISTNVTYHEWKNLVIDGNNVGDTTGYGWYTNDGIIIRNVEIKNLNNSYIVRNGGRFFNCYFHNNVADNGCYLGQYYNCIVASNSSYGFNAVNVAINCIGKSNPGANYIFCQYTANCISDGSVYGFYIRAYSVLLNCIIMNATNHGVWDDYGCALAVNCNFYNNTINYNSKLVRIQNIYTYAPEFTDSTNLDYTRTGTNLDDIGYSTVGLQTFDYNVDIGLDQKTLVSSAPSISNITCSNYSPTELQNITVTADITNSPTQIVCIINNNSVAMTLSSGTTYTTGSVSTKNFGTCSNKNITVLAAHVSGGDTANAVNTITITAASIATHDIKTIITRLKTLLQNNATLAAYIKKIEYVSPRLLPDIASSVVPYIGIAPVSSSESWIAQKKEAIHTVELYAVTYLQIPEAAIIGDSVKKGILEVVDDIEVAIRGQRLKSDGVPYLSKPLEITNVEYSVATYGDQAYLFVASLTLVCPTLSNLVLP